MNENFVQWLQEGNITIPATLLKCYKQMNINEEELVLLLHVLSFLEKGNGFPTPTELSSRMTISISQCTEGLRKLIQKGFIEIKDGLLDNGIRYEKYSLDPLWGKLAEQFLLSKKAEKLQKQQEDESDLYSIFEREFGRPLSPMECETMAMWIDDDRHGSEIIIAALREAVISGKLNFRYIDRILFEWKKNGVKTVEQAKNQGRKFRQYQTQSNQPRNEEQLEKKKTVPFYNWLEQQ